MSIRSRALDLIWHRRLSDEAGPFDPGQVRKILVVRNDNIGDVICTTPALDALKQAFPQAHIAALVCTLAQEAMEGHRALDALYVYPKAKHKVHGPIRSHLILANLLAELKKEQFDLAVAFRANFSTSQAWLAYASGARWRLGPRAEGKRKSVGFYYNLPAEPPPVDLHEVQRCFHLLSQISVDTEPKSLYLKVPGPALQKARKWLHEHGLKDTGPLVVVNMTRWAYRPDRHWPDERWQELLQGIAQRGWPLAVSHAPADRNWVKELLAGLKNPPPVFWSRSLKEFGALASLARPFVTAEGGPMHIGAAVDAPLVVLWGRTALNNWRPWDADARILQAGGDVSRISVDEVLAAVGEYTAAPGDEEKRNLAK